MKLLDKLLEKKETERKKVVAVYLKETTINKIEELAKQANMSVSVLVGEILEMGLTIGDSVEIVGQQLEGFASKVLEANNMMLKVVKKPTRKTAKKSFAGRRKKG